MNNDNFPLSCNQALFPSNPHQIYQRNPFKRSDLDYALSAGFTSNKHRFPVCFSVDFPIDFAIDFLLVFLSPFR